jgi:leader peptidase (prepilin peptidase)/N-methyltransferase
MVAVLAGVLGLAIGSFLNVVIYRVPRGESVVSPPSHCPRCGTEIQARHNVPVLGWLMLQGRCASCGLPISPRYPLVEGATGLLFFGVTLGLALGGLLWVVPPALLAVAIGLVAGLVAYDRAPLPKKTIGVSAAIVAAWVVVGALLNA